MRCTNQRHLAVLLGAGLFLTSGAAGAVEGTSPDDADCNATWTMDEQHAGHPVNVTMFESKAELDAFRKNGCTPDQVRAKVKRPTYKERGIN